MDDSGSLHPAGAGALTGCGSHRPIQHSVTETVCRGGSKRFTAQGPGPPSDASPAGWPRVAGGPEGVPDGHLGSPSASTQPDPSRRCGQGPRVSLAVPRPGHFGRRSLEVVELGAMDERSERMARRFELPILAAALLVIPVIVLEQADVGEPFDTIASVFNWLIWLAFLAEAVAMLSVVPDRWRWIRENPLDVAIVVLTPPFLPQSLQALRIFRLLRPARVLVLVKASIAGPGSQTD
jgi:hypothetical protein